MTSTQNRKNRAKKKTRRTKEKKKKICQQINGDNGKRKKKLYIKNSDLIYIEINSEAEKKSPQRNGANASPSECQASDKTNGF
jgi:hypothetical protein